MATHRRLHCAANKEITRPGHKRKHRELEVCGIDANDLMRRWNSRNKRSSPFEVGGVTDPTDFLKSKVNQIQLQNSVGKLPASLELDSGFKDSHIFGFAEYSDDNMGGLVSPAGYRSISPNCPFGQEAPQQPQIPMNLTSVKALAAKGNPASQMTRRNLPDAMSGPIPVPDGLSPGVSSFSDPTFTLGESLINQSTSISPNESPSLVSIGKSPRHSEADARDSNASQNFYDGDDSAQYSPSDRRAPYVERMQRSTKWIFEACYDSKDDDSKEDQSSECGPNPPRAVGPELDEDTFGRQQRDLALALDCF